MNKVIPLRSAEVIDRRDPAFWRDKLRSSEIEKFVADMLDYRNGDLLRRYERICGGDDDSPEAA